MLYLIPKETLNVDRWSVISSFWDNYFEDKYVYYAKSFGGNYPGPMPFYFILAFPFYLIGELGLYSILGIILFLFLIKKHLLNDEKQLLNMFLLTSLSLFYLWEIVTRSNIFFNGTLILISIYYFFRKYQKSMKYNFIFGIVFGLVLSTRNVFVIPLIITFLFALKFNKINFKNIVTLGIIAVFTFCATFLPFVYNHIDDFIIMNPFIIQSSFLMPTQYTIGFVILSFLSYFFCKSESDVYFYSSLVLFFTIVFYFGYRIIITDFETTFYQSSADISYLILCIPFAMFHFIFNENKTII